ncbi:hypothetical protein [Frigoribacterium faeni]|uniref:hypothetical protein n=1 Tax=Frigoribacterium faeni TaxID=145483 RepID=UPI0024137132|nr:hypothetical protein [Frigoribacterium faeni]
MFDDVPHDLGQLLGEAANRLDGDRDYPRDAFGTDGRGLYQGAIEVGKGTTAPTCLPACGDVGGAEGDVSVAKSKLTEHGIGP